jgi:outer membrane lipoprotein-sorting protein
MRKWIIVGCALGLMAGLGLGVASASAATLDEVLALLNKNEATVKNFEADVKISAKAAGQAVESTGHMVAQPVVKDGKRGVSLMNMKQKMTVAGMAMETLMVCDGEFIWTETRNPQIGVMVTKNKIDPTKQQTGDAHELQDQYDLKLVGEEEFDSQKTWILEGTPKAKPADKAADKTAAGAPSMDPAAQVGKVRINVGQTDNMTRRVRTYDKADQEVSDMQMTNIKLNGTLDPALFKYTPPEGAMIMDLTKGMPNMQDMMKNMPKGDQ